MFYLNRPPEGSLTMIHTWKLKLISNFSTGSSNSINWMFLAVAPSESVVITHVTEHPKLIPGKTYTPAGSIGVTEDASRNGLAEGLQHVLQLLLVHGHRQVWDVKVGGVLLLLLNGEKKGKDWKMRMQSRHGELFPEKIRTSPFKKWGAIQKAAGRSCVRCMIFGWVAGAGY